MESYPIPVDEILFPSMVFGNILAVLVHPVKFQRFGNVPLITRRVPFSSVNTKILMSHFASTNWSHVVVLYNGPKLVGRPLGTKPDHISHVGLVWSLGGGVHQFYSIVEY